LEVYAGTNPRPILALLRAPLLYGTAHCAAGGAQAWRLGDTCTLAVGPALRVLGPAPAAQ
jgi:hypothetical protein